jgi:hypothetical protein
MESGGSLPFSQEPQLVSILTEINTKVVAIFEICMVFVM